MRAAALSLTAALLTPACQNNPIEQVPDNPVGQAQVCTLIGCESGFRVIFHPPLASLPYSVRLDLRGSGKASFTCTISSPRDVTGGIRVGLCDQTQFGVSLSPEPKSLTIEVLVNSSGGAVIERRVRSFTPVYQVSQPNGPGCPPICRQATLVMGAGVR